MGQVVPWIPPWLDLRSGEGNFLVSRVNATVDGATEVDGATDFQALSP
jgi:hypothetical protein